MILVQTIDCWTNEVNIELRKIRDDVSDSNVWVDEGKLCCKCAGVDASPSKLNTDVGDVRHWCARSPGERWFESS